MSPFRHASIPYTRPLTRIKPRSTTRPFTSYTSSPSHAVQIFHSTSHDPYLNLSIEHHLLTTSHPDSTLLFLYRNRPCVVIGRNQNPWKEANLRALRAGIDGGGPEPVSVVRRRSGGGAVFHDLGNANWSVICPSSNFDRDRHAEMVVRALRGLGVRGVRVNERHDIVQDVERSGGKQGREAEMDTFKVSGSAYKLTRLRSLHHGTCLLSSVNLQLGLISRFLSSPAAPYIRSRGVESVRSKVRNVGVEYDAFVGAVTDKFQSMYGAVEGGSIAVGEDALAIEEVERGFNELRSHDWIYGQTPQFTFSTKPTDSDPRPRPPLPKDVPDCLDISLTVRHGQIQNAHVSGLPHSHAPADAAQEDAAVSKALEGKRLYEIRNWHYALWAGTAVPLKGGRVGNWLDEMLGVSPQE